MCWCERLLRAVGKVCLSWSLGLAGQWCVLFVIAFDESSTTLISGCLWLIELLAVYCWLKRLVTDFFCFLVEGHCLSLGGFSKKIFVSECCLLRLQVSSRCFWGLGVVHWDAVFSLWWILWWWLPCHRLLAIIGIMLQHGDKWADKVEILLFR